MRHFPHVSRGGERIVAFMFHQSLLLWFCYDLCNASHDILCTWKDNGISKSLAPGVSADFFAPVSVCRPSLRHPHEPFALHRHKAANKTSISSPSYQKEKMFTALARSVGKGSFGRPKLDKKFLLSFAFAALRIRLV